jgi:UDP-N-acetylglucosamine-lysosomal-enzyme
MYMVASLINPYTSPQLGTSYSTLVNALRASPFEGRNTSIETDQIPQIDFVYTWVNGSDPKQLEMLRIAKSNYMLERNLTALRPCNETEKPADGVCYKDEGSTANRFEDNDELKYSLRSIWKNARPWIRHIYLITNGQVPSWLDLNNPMITIVTHEQIYANKSHLPTFSSPSIETHLHRIKGLSDKFLYLNDDVMFGREVWPDDFFTRGRGQKVYLSWPVPQCNDGCPANWIGDGYCDLACNVSSCDWDGGDCANQTSTSSSTTTHPWWGQANTNNRGSPTEHYCVPGCPDSWIGDKYCDRACRNVQCGMDAGDCGVDQIAENLFAIVLTADAVTLDTPNNSADDTHNVTNTSGTSETEYKKGVTHVQVFPHQIVTGVNTTHDNVVLAQLDDQLVAAYINMSAVIVEADTITDSYHDNSDMIRTATISQKHKVMTLTFHRNKQGHMAQIVIQYRRAGQEAEHQVAFNISLGTPQPRVAPQAPNNDTDVTHAPSTANDVTAVTPVTEAHVTVTPVTAALVTGAQPITIEDDTARTQRSLLSLDEEPIIRRRPRRQEHELSERLTQEQLSVLLRAAQTGIDYREHPAFPWDQTTVKVRAGRRLLDTYGESLKYANRLLNAEFGTSPRHVPAHMPHMIDKHLMQQLQDHWPQHFERTSSHLFREPDDLQYAFTYFYYLMHQRIEYNFTNVFNNLDADHSGTLDLNELRTLAVEVLASQQESRLRANENHLFVLTAAMFYNFTDNILHCPEEPVPVASTNETESSVSVPTSAVEVPLSEPESAQSNNETRSDTSVLLQLEAMNISVTLRMLTECPHVMRQIDQYYKKRLRNKFEVLDTEEVAFIMIPTNSTELLPKLDGIRQKRHKFLCLNDDLNHTNPEAKRVIKVVQDLLRTLFPDPSPFELGPGVYNKHLWVQDYLDEHSEQQQANQHKKNLIYVLFLVLCVALFMLVRTCSADLPRKNRQGRSVRESRYLNLLNV